MLAVGQRRRRARERGLAVGQPDPQQNRQNADAVPLWDAEDWEVDPDGGYAQRHAGDTSGWDAPAPAGPVPRGSTLWLYPELVEQLNEVASVKIDAQRGPATFPGAPRVEPGVAGDVPARPWIHSAAIRMPWRAGPASAVAPATRAGREAPDRTVLNPPSPVPIFPDRFTPWPIARPQEQWEPFGGYAEDEFVPGGAAVLVDWEPV